MTHFEPTSEKKSGRKNRLRQEILTLLENKHGINAKDLRASIVLAGQSPHKTSVYRELESMLQAGLVCELNFGDGEKRYELAKGEHHHHLVCNTCGIIVPINFEDDLDTRIGKLAEKHCFKIIHHSLEFFGLCQTCSSL